MILLSGTPIREKIKDEIRQNIFSRGIYPELVIIQVGDNPESNVYINQKQKFGDDAGVIVQHLKYSENINEEDLISKIKDLNNNPEVNGIIVQLPLPKNLDKRKILDSISPEKDVDGLSFVQQKFLVDNNSKKIIPATARGIISILDFYKIDIKNKKVVIIGYSDLVGKPVSILFNNLGANTEVCDENTKNIKEISKTADILVVACGVLKLVNKSFVKSGAVVIDVGIHKTKPNLYGDVDFDSVKNIVSAITPVPGGVGPTTVAYLFKNVLDAYDLQHKIG